jgi:hypothetical protein
MNFPVMLPVILPTLYNNSERKSIGYLKKIGLLMGVGYKSHAVLLAESEPKIRKKRHLMTIEE